MGMSSHASRDGRRIIHDAGIPRTVFSRSAMSDNAAYEQSSEQLLLAERAAWPSISDVARCLALSLSAVTALIATGRLASASLPSGDIVIPPWQVTSDGRLLPHLREVSDAVPADMDVLDVAFVMTTVDEAFDGLSPAEWLYRGNDLDRVVSFLEGLGWI